jgi:sugar/nucleoside kinase (ribokinase family)
MRTLKIDSSSPYQRLIGVGGVGTGVFFRLAGDPTLGRNESRSGELLDVRDYCKLHIVIHYIAKLLGAGKEGSGFEVLPLAKVGDDTPGRAVLKEMEEVGIDTRLVDVLAAKPTLFSVCFQYPDGSGGNITANNSAAANLSDTDLEKVREEFAADPSRTIALSVPEVSLSVRRRFLEIAAQAGCLRAGSFVAGEIARARDLGMFKLLDLVAFNESEATELLDCEFSETHPEPLVEKSLSLVNHVFPGMRLIISLGARGVMGFAADQWIFCPAPKVAVASTAGAGDALLAGVISGLASGMPFLRSGPPGEKADGEPLQCALEFGAMLASYSVTSPHTIHPSVNVDNLAEFFRASGVRIGPNLEELFVENCAKEGR